MFNLVPRTEKELSHALAHYHVISGTEEILSEDEAKAILVDHLNVDNKPWFTRKIFAAVIDRVNWQNVIDASLDRAMLTSVRIELLCRQIDGKS